MNQTTQFRAGDKVRIVMGRTKNSNWTDESKDADINRRVGVVVNTACDLASVDFGLYGRNLQLDIDDIELAGKQKKSIKPWVLK